MMLLACYYGHLNIVQFLFHNGAKDEIRRPKNDGRTPMIAACQEGHLNIVQFLFRNGAKDDIRRSNNKGASSARHQYTKLSTKQTPLRPMAHSTRHANKKQHLNMV